MMLFPSLAYEDDNVNGKIRSKYFHLPPCAALVTNIEYTKHQIYMHRESYTEVDPKKQI